MLGDDIIRGFRVAQSAMSSYQAALLDDDKDGEYTTNDCGQPARTSAFIHLRRRRPADRRVCGDQILTDQTSAMLWIGNVGIAPHGLQQPGA